MIRVSTPDTTTGTYVAHSPTIVVVEDEAILRELVIAVLSDIGASVIAVETADEGAKAIALHKPDLIITDVVTPGSIDGWELAWRSHQASPAIPIIVMSGFHLRMSDALPPAAVFLPKPWTIDALCACVEAQLRTTTHH